ncbi:MAG: long-chain fatty acid--CoA ligase [Dehalococcoidia bacterium]
MNVAELAEQEIARYGEHGRVLFEGRELTNTEMDREARKLGTALRELGVKRGDRVMIQAPNCPEVVQSFQAIWKIGAVVVPVNYLIAEDETAHIYSDSGAETLISNSMFLPKIDACRARAPAVKNVILIDTEAPRSDLYGWKLVENSPDKLDFVRTDDDELAALIYTAGTTGRPKGVMHSHYGLCSNAQMVADTITLPEGMVSILILPLCHMYGIGSMNASYVRGGGRAIILPSFDVEKLFAAIETHRGNLVAAVPTMYVYMLLYPEPKKYDLSSMRWWVSGSSALAVETWKNFRAKYGFEIIEGWGLTEAGATNCCNPLDGPVKVGSIGQPMRGTEMRVVDSDGNKIPPGQEGELIIRSTALMQGYWNRPEETAEILRDGWVYSGDVGYVDEDGYYFITDRKKDLIIKAGENIHPREIEEVLFAHPKVSEAAVVGIKDDIYGEDIKAFVVLKPGMQATEAEITEHCKARLKDFKSPKELQFMEALPKNLLGKVLRKELRGMR